MTVYTTGLRPATLAARLSAGIPQGLTANPLRDLALGTMILDHLASGFLPTGSPLWIILRLLGRISMPLMCFFLAEGFYHTSSLRRYALRLLAFAVLSHIPFAVYFGVDPLRETGVLWGLLMGLLALAVWKQETWSWWKKIPVMAVLTALSLPADWGYISVVWVLAFGVFRGNRRRQLVRFTLSGLLLYVLPVAGELMQSAQGWSLYGYRLGFFLAIPLMISYNGRRAPGRPAARWAVYAVYPVHLALLAALRYGLESLF